MISKQTKAIIKSEVVRSEFGMFYDRQTKIFTDVSKAPKQSKAVVIVKVFVGSSLIFYGSILVAYFVLNKLFILAGFCSIIPLLGFMLFKKPDPNKQLKKDMKRFDRYNSLS